MYFGTTNTSVAGQYLVLCPAVGGVCSGRLPDCLHWDIQQRAMFSCVHSAWGAYRYAHRYVSWFRILHTHVCTISCDAVAPPPLPHTLICPEALRMYSVCSGERTCGRSSHSLHSFHSCVPMSGLLLITFINVLKLLFHCILGIYI